MRGARWRLALDITRAVARLSAQAERKFGVTINVRVGVNRGVVHLDTARDDVLGYAVNLSQRISALAEPGTVAVSDPSPHWSATHSSSKRVRRRQ